ALAACMGPDAEGRGARHLSFPVWTGAIERQFERPEQYVPEAFLLGSTLLLIDEDKALQHDLAEDSSITEASTANGDAVGVGLALLDSKSSFPSGHTNFAFVAATHLARSIADSTDEWYGNLGYLFWLPAAYVG